MMSTDLLFVYGTLRRAAVMHRLLGPADFVGPGEFQGRLYHLGNYPGVVRSDDPADVVHGEVYRLQEPVETLALLDEYEGGEYSRGVDPIRLTGGGAVWAHLYLYRGSLTGRRRILSGDFLADE